MSEGELDFLKNYNETKPVQQTIKVPPVKQTGQDFGNVSLTSASREILTQKIQRIDRDSDMYRSKHY
jgi:hypothetical protein